MVVVRWCLKVVVVEENGGDLEEGDGCGLLVVFGF